MPVRLRRWPSLGAFKHFLRDLAGEAFVVYSKAPFGSPEAVVAYLGRYSHRVALSNTRIMEMEGGWVHFRYKNYRQGGRWDTMKLRAEEFIRRFLLRMLPKGLHKLRHDGLLASALRPTKLAQALLASVPPRLAEVGERVAASVERCPVCQVGQMLFRDFVAGSQVTAWRLQHAGGRAVYDTA